MDLRKLLIFLLFLAFFSVRSENLDSLYDVSIESLKTRSLDSAKVDALSYLSAAKAEDDEFHLVKAYYILGFISAEIEDFGNSVIYYLEGIKIGETQSNMENQEDLISMYKNIGNILGDYHHFNLAHKFINRGIEIARKNNNIRQEKLLLSNRIHELLDEQKYHDALHEIDNLSENYDLDSLDVISLKNKTGIAYKGLEDYENSIENFQFILNYASPTNNFYAYALQNIGEILMKKGEYEKSLPYLEKAKQIEKQNGIKEQLILNLYNLSKVYSQKHDYASSLQYLKEAEVVETEMRSRYIRPDVIDVYNLISETYKKLDNTTEALNYQNIYLKKLSEKEPIIELMTERHFDLLNAHLEKEKSKQLAQWGIAGMAIFLFLVICIYIKYYRTKSNIKGEINRLIRSFSRPVM